MASPSQYPGGKVLDHWSTVTPEEEPLVLRQFLRFGETRSIVELMTFQGHEASDPELKPAPKISKVVPERSRRSPAGLWPAGDINGIHHFEKLASGLSALLPFHFPCSAFQCLVSPTKVTTSRYSSARLSFKVSKVVVIMADRAQS